MVIKSKVFLNFARKLLPSGKTNFALGIINGTTHTAEFPNTIVAVADLQQACSTLSVILAARPSNHAVIAALTNDEKIWDDDFKLTAHYVSSIANDKLIRNAGCTPAKNETVPTKVLPTGSNVETGIDKRKTNISANCELQAGTNTYKYIAMPGAAGISMKGDTIQLTTGGNTIYVKKDTHCKMHSTSLVSGTLLYVSMYGVDRAGAGLLSSSQQVLPQ